MFNIEKTLLPIKEDLNDSDDIIRNSSLLILNKQKLEITNKLLKSMSYTLYLELIHYNTK